MDIKISMVSQIPVYEQIKGQIREKVLNGELKPGDYLPSIRLMAKELRVGIITVRRVYDDLSAEGVLVSAPGKGVFVAELDSKKIKSAYEEVIRKQVKDLLSYAKSVGISKETVEAMVKEVEI